jgi:hypothetical protein
MCVHIGADVILANLLTGPRKNIGVTYEDINRFCKNVKIALSNIPTKPDSFVYFAVNERDLQETLIRYPDTFNSFRDKFYCTENINIDNFNKRYAVEIRSILNKASLNI